MNRPVAMIGVDPGISGAIALLDGGLNLVDVWDMPVQDKPVGKGRQVNAHELVKIMDEIRDSADGRHLFACVERVGGRAGEGVSTAFSFGETAGVIRGVLTVFGLPITYVAPDRWKSGVGLTGKGKGASRSLAQQYWPEQSDKFSRVKDDGRAEAALIARYTAMTFQRQRA